MKPLSELSKGCEAHVAEVRFQTPDDQIAARLQDLGFVSGEPVKLVAHGPFGTEPLLVQVGFTRFALRRSEAARVWITEKDACNA